MYQGSINLGSSTSTTSGCAFYVDTHGYLEAVSGKIGGATIYATSLQYTSNSMFSENLIGCGVAGNGTVALCGSGQRGGNSQGSIQICNQYDHTHNEIHDGLQIDGTGLIRHYDSNGNENWWFDLATGNHGT